MIRCREVAELLTSGRLRESGILTRMQVTVHLWMCRYCARLARQLKQLRAAASELAAAIGGEKTGTPEDRLETRLIRKLSDTNR